jgi:hypothetical protein
MTNEMNLLYKVDLREALLVSTSTNAVVEQKMVPHDNIQITEEHTEEEDVVEYIIDDVVVERGDPLVDIGRARRMTIAYNLLRLIGLHLIQLSGPNLKAFIPILDLSVSLSLPRTIKIWQYLDDIMEAHLKGRTYEGYHHINLITGPIGL